MSSPNNGTVTITYTYNNQRYTDTGSFTLYDNYNFIATINDDKNFPTNCLTPGILVQVKLDNSTNKISLVSTIINIRYLYPSSLSSPPISYVNIKGNVIQNNNNSIPVNYNMKFQNIEEAYISYSFIPESLLEPIPDYFSQAALNQVARTRDQASALLTTLDLGITKAQSTQIANLVGLIAGYSVSIGECVKKISDTVTKK